MLPRWLRRFVLVARILVVACVLQLSGGAHIVFDLVGGADAACVVDACACADDACADDHGCPLDCADCACPHGRLPSLPPEVTAAVPAQIAWDLLAPWTPSLSGTPPSPPRSSLERPPRG